MRTIKITTRKHPPTSGLTPRMWAEYSVRRRYDWVLIYNKIEPTWTGTNKLLFYDVTNKANKTITKRYVPEREHSFVARMGAIHGKYRYPITCTTWSLPATSL